MSEITLILGGAKSGKTSLALARCNAFPPPRIYLATAEARDPEMAVRIARHQAERGPEWRTIEEPLDPVTALDRLRSERVGVVLLDCLTLWLSNLMAGQGLDADAAVARVEGLADTVSTVSYPVVIVSNEVGQGIVPDNKLARDFRDASGMSHQVLARRATHVLMAAAGLELRLK
ncbi:MAG: bifunctional adenosylcobinamide kinase/adenosylcobinamide-phosphate guanylyltransferase [Proteobacteria bacterium]|nr:bifunctional adenosylcobinamide kinase/adenosylcobinamide-phosphate guanylyltransferase [Pseudomonadota bacterium]